MKKIITIALSYLLPVLAFADTTVIGADSLITKVNSILKSILPIIVSVAVIYFVYQVLMYTISGDEEKKKVAKGGMIYGIIGLFVMVSIWGLVGILSGTFNFTATTPSLPGLPTSTSN